MTENPVLFLDFDGVLNSHDWWERRPKVVKGDRWARELNEFDPAAVGLLNGILMATDCDVVVSSTWRKGRNIQQLRDLLVAAGLVRPEKVISVTPDAYAWGADVIKVTGTRRGAEIAAWLQAHRPNGCTFAILDDDSDMGSVLHRLVQTPYSVGLTAVTAERVRKLLMEQDDD